jgi:hypothetical protein
MTLLSAVCAAEHVAPYGIVGPTAYYGCSGIYLELARQNEDLSRIRARLRRLELETDESVRARQWISTLDAENRNLRQQNVLFQRRVIELERELDAKAHENVTTPEPQDASVGICAPTKPMDACVEKVYE